LDLSVEQHGGERAGVIEQSMQNAGARVWKSNHGGTLLETNDSLTPQGLMVTSDTEIAQKIKT
jgi:hypothetical protein